MQQNITGLRQPNDWHSNNPYVQFAHCCVTRAVHNNDTHNMLVQANPPIASEDNSIARASNKGPKNILFSGFTKVPALPVRPFPPD